MSRVSDPLELGGTSDGVADVVHNQLSQADDAGHLDDPNLFVLLACSPGESSLWSEPLRQSVFGYYFQRAFADLEADRDDGGTISVKELSAYLAQNVDRWANQHRGVAHGPVLIGTAQDFRLAPVNRTRAKALLENSSRPETAVKEETRGEEKVADKKKGEEQGEGGRHFQEGRRRTGEGKG